MKVLAAPTVTEKVAGLDEHAKRRLSELFLDLQKLTPAKVVESQDPELVLDKEKKIFLTRRGNLRVIFTVGDEPDPYALILDVISEIPIATPRRPTKDPRSNPTLNPYVNSQINPIINTQLNPVVNTELNPIVNSDLNPLINTALNPLINLDVNPIVNPGINPSVNPHLNPAINPAINPMTNPDFAGLRFYDLHLFPKEFAIQPNDQVVLCFDNNSRFTGLGVLNPIEGYTLFDRQNNWVGYLVPDGQGGFLHFTNNAQWVGIVV